MRYAIKNFLRFQHYIGKAQGDKPYTPPWIKLYANILNDPAFCALSELSRYHYLALLILASQTHNVIEDDPAYLQLMLRLHKPADLSPLIRVGFLVPLDPEPDQVSATVCPALPTPLVEPVSRAKPKVLLPETWVPTEKHEKQAHALGLNFAIEVAHFRGISLEKQWKRSNWDQAFSNFMLQEIKFREARRA